MSDLRISIAMCTYNGGNFISEQLESILSQTILPDELIICDDQSTDNTVNIIYEFKSRAPFKVDIFINSEKLGSTKNFEKAINLCSGDVIFLADQDDTWEKCKIQKIIREFKNNPKIGLIFTDANMVDQDLRSLGYKLWESVGFSRKEKIIFQKRYLDLLIKYNVVTGATCAFRSEARSVFSPISSLWVHDAWITFILSAINDMEILYLEDTLINYRQHSNNQIGAIKKTILTKFKKILQNNKKMQIRQEISQLEVIKEHLINLDSIEVENISLVNNKIDFLNFRVSLKGNLFIKILCILKNRQFKNYLEYSNGLRSIAKDLFIN